MLTIKERYDIINKLEELVKNCDGVLMASRGGSYSHNFACTMKTALNQLAFGLENGALEEHVEHD